MTGLISNTSFSEEAAGHTHDSILSKPTRGNWPLAKQAGQQPPGPGVQRGGKELFPGDGMLPCHLKNARNCVHLLHTSVKAGLVWFLKTKAVGWASIENTKPRPGGAQGNRRAPGQGGERTASPDGSSLQHPRPQSWRQRSPPECLVVGWGRGSECPQGKGKLQPSGPHRGNAQRRAGRQCREEAKGSPSKPQGQVCRRSTEQTSLGRRTAPEVRAHRKGLVEVTSQAQF